MVFSNKTLTPLQQKLMEVMKDFPDGWVTGGTALAGYLGHRRSKDIDYFVTAAPDVDHASSVLERACMAIGLGLNCVRHYPGFRRYEVCLDEERTLVDIVHEVVHQVIPLEEKPLRDGVRVDSMEDLAANKLAALLGRGDVKDLVDLYFLADSGVNVLDHLPDARKKDGGMEPSTLAYVLKTMSLDTAGLILLEPIIDEALAAFRDELIDSLLKASWPH